MKAQSTYLTEMSLDIVIQQTTKKNKSKSKISKNLTSHYKLRCLMWIILNNKPLNCFQLQELWTKEQILNSIKGICLDEDSNALCY